MRRRLSGVVIGLWIVLSAGPAGAQVTTQPPPTTRPPDTTVPITTAPEPPPTEPQTTVATAPPPTRPRSSTTRNTTSTTAGPTTTHSLLPAPAVAPQDPAVPPTGSTQSDRISSFFYVLSILGFATAIALLTAQWFLTRPGRRGWTL
ncbi:MAG: hypothetical protein QOJ09_457 [Actinomycetota bacterium]|nr:hypothetical protein [Actinomycetota bacterium]